MDPNHGGGQDEQNPQILGGYCPDGQNWGVSVEDFESPYHLPHIPDSSVPLDSIWPNQGVAGTVPHGAPQGTSHEWNSLNGSHLQSWNFVNQSVAGTKQPASGAFEFADNVIQTHEELNEQEFNQLLADAFGIEQHLVTQLGQAGVFNSIDQGSLLPVSGTQLPESRMPPGIYPLSQQLVGQAAATVDSLSIRTIGESKISEAKWKRLVRKRECDRQYRTREKVKKQKLEVENEELRAQNEELRAQNEVLKNVVLELELEHKRKPNHLKLKSCELKKTELEAENEDLKEKFLLLEGRYENAMWLLGEMKSMMKQIGKQGIKKPKGKPKKQVMIAETAEETKNDD